MDADRNVPVEDFVYQEDIETASTLPEQYGGRRFVQEEEFGPWSVELKAPLAEKLEDQRVAEINDAVVGDREDLLGNDELDEEAADEDDELKELKGDKSVVKKVGHAIKEAGHQVSVFSKRCVGTMD